MVEHLYTYINPVSERDLSRTCSILDNNGVIGYPTDVNWAFGCDAASPKAMDRIRMLKPMHPKEQPFSLLCSSISMVAEFCVVDQPAYRLMRKVLPGPYTILLPRSKSLPRSIKDKRKVVGVRIPDSPLLLALIEQHGRPLATTSVPKVERHSCLPAGAQVSMGYQLAEIFGHGLDLILDLGEEILMRETTIVDLTTGVPQLERIGVGDASLFTEP